LELALQFWRGELDFFGPKYGKDFGKGFEKGGIDMVGNFPLLRKGRYILKGMNRFF